MVGIVVPTLSDLYYSYLIQNIEIYAKSLGISLVIQNTVQSESAEVKCINYLRSIGIQGIILLNPCTPPVQEDIPIVIVGEKMPGAEVDTISLNNYTAGMKAAEHLLSLGYIDIAYVSAPFGGEANAGKRRLEEVKDYMKAKDLDSRLQVLVANNKAMKYIHESDYGVQMTEELLHSHPKCTAIIANNDMIAMGCISVLNKKGYEIPQDIAICGFDNLYIDKIFFPQLTSIEQMSLHGCKVGLSILLEKINKLSLRDMPVLIEYEPRPYVRGSTVIG